MLAEAEDSGDGVEQVRTALELWVYYEAALALAHCLTNWSKQIEKQRRRFGCHVLTNVTKTR